MNEQVLKIRQIHKETQFGAHKIGKILSIPKCLVDSIIYRNGYKEIA